METLTINQAYAAMVLYMVAIYERTGSSDIGALLGGMSLLADGGTVDPAAWADWEEAVSQVAQGRYCLDLDLQEN